MAIQIDPTLQAKLDQAFQRFWFQDNEQLKAFVQQFVWDNRISLPAELQQVKEYAANRYPYWKLPVIIPKPASPTIPPLYPDSPHQTLPERPPGTFWETPAGTWAKDHWLMLSLGGIAIWYLLDTPKGKKKRPINLSYSPTESDEFSDCGCNLEGSECADVQPASESPVSAALPGSVGDRRGLLEKCGSGSFLMPGGTQARPGIPGYPIMLDDCCYHCGMMKAAYTRIGQALNRKGSILEKSRLKFARDGLIRKAAKFADRSDKTNACNWSLTAAKRLRIRLSGDNFPFELGRVRTKDLFKVPRGQVVLTEEDIAESGDQIIQCLERQGWKEKRIREIQEAIAEKMTPDLFTQETEELTGGEAMYQEAVDECLERIRKGRGSKRDQAELFSGAKRVKYNRADINSAISAAIRTVWKEPKYVYATHGGYTVDTRKPPRGQDYIQVEPEGKVTEHLYHPKEEKWEITVLGECEVGELSGEGCRDKDGNFVPVPACTGRFIKEAKKAEKVKKAEPAKRPPNYPNRDYIITNTKPEGTKKKGYKEYIVYNNNESKATRKEAYTRIWGLPVKFTYLEDYEFFIATFGLGYRMIEASTGLAITSNLISIKEAEREGKARLRKYPRDELVELIDRADKVQDVKRYATAVVAPEAPKPKPEPEPVKPVRKIAYSKRYDDILKSDVYTMEGLANTIDLKARIFSERKTEHGRTVKRYYPQIDDDKREVVTQVNPDGYLFIKTAKKALEEELIEYLHGEGEWAQNDIEEQYKPVFHLAGLGSLSGDGCRDKDGNFVPVPACTGRMKPKEKKEPKVKARPKKKKPPTKKQAPESEVEWYASKYPDDPITQRIKVYKSKKKYIKAGYAKGVHYRALYPQTGFEYWISAKELREGYKKIKEPIPEEPPAKPEKKKAPSRDIEPWMMTRDEWQNAIDANKPETAQSRPTKRDKSEALARVRRLEFLHAGVDAPWDPEFKEIRRITHRDVILKAMSEDQPVPQEILDEYLTLDVEARALRAIADGATIDSLEKKLKLQKWEARRLLKSMLKRGNIYEIDGKYYPFQLARIQEILEKKGKKPEPAKAEPEPKPVDTQKGTTLAPWMTAEPFTQEEVRYGNMLTHYPQEWNEVFAKEVAGVEKNTRAHLSKYGIDELPPNVLEAMEKYRKSVYDTYKAHWRHKAYYPPVSVVGPSKYPYHRKEKAMARDRKTHERKQAAVKKLDKEVRKAVGGRTLKITIDTHMDVAATNSRTAFGNQYAKVEMEGKARTKGFEHVYRKRGREIHKELVEEAMKKGNQVLWAAVKDYPELQDYERIIDRPLKSQMPETQHERIINAKPTGGKPRGYAAFLKMIPGDEYKDAKFQWVWGKPIVVKGFQEYQFFIAKYGGKYSVYEASTGKAASGEYSSMDAAHTNAEKRLMNAKEYFDEAFAKQKKIPDYEGMAPIYDDMISKIPGKRSAKAERPDMSNEDKILELLEAGEMHIDDIGKQVGMEPYQVSAALVMLEIEGRVRQKAGKMFELKTASTSGVSV